jgi:two-component system, response regulator PdtaR
VILVVEDEILLRMAAADEFRRQGFAVFEAGDANEARHILQSEAVDLLFTDLQLSGARLPAPAAGFDGLALIRLVRATRPEMKVVIASGLVRPDDNLAEANMRIADACFGKPYDFVRIVAVIRKLLANRDPRPAPQSSAFAINPHTPPRP